MKIFDTAFGTPPKGGGGGVGGDPARDGGSGSPASSPRDPVRTHPDELGLRADPSVADMLRRCAEEPHVLASTRGAVWHADTKGVSQHVFLLSPHSLWVVALNGAICTRIMHADITGMTRFSIPPMVSIEYTDDTHTRVMYFQCVKVQQFVETLLEGVPMHVPCTVKKTLRGFEVNEAVHAVSRTEAGRHRLALKISMKTQGPGEVPVEAGRRESPRAADGGEELVPTALPADASAAQAEVQGQTVYYAKYVRCARGDGGGEEVPRLLAVTRTAVHVWDIGDAGGVVTPAAERLPLANIASILTSSRPGALLALRGTDGTHDAVVAPDDPKMLVRVVRILALKIHGVRLQVLPWDVEGFAPHMFARGGMFYAGGYELHLYRAGPPSPAGHVPDVAEVESTTTLDSPSPRPWLTLRPVNALDAAAAGEEEEDAPQLPMPAQLPPLPGRRGTMDVGEGGRGGSDGDASGTDGEYDARLGGVQDTAESAESADPACVDGGIAGSPVRRRGAVSTYRPTTPTHPRARLALQIPRTPQEGPGASTRGARVAPAAAWGDADGNAHDAGGGADDSPPASPLARSPLKPFQTPRPRQRVRRLCSAADSASPTVVGDAYTGAGAGAGTMAGGPGPPAAATPPMNYEDPAAVPVADTRTPGRGNVADILRLATTLHERGDDSGVARLLRGAAGIYEDEDAGLPEADHGGFDQLFVNHNGSPLFATDDHEHTPQCSPDAPFVPGKGVGTTHRVVVETPSFPPPPILAEGGMVTLARDDDAGSAASSTPPPSEDPPSTTDAEYRDPYNTSVAAAPFQEEDDDDDDDHGTAGTSPLRGPAVSPRATRRARPSLSPLCASPRGMGVGAPGGNGGASPLAPRASSSMPPPASPTGVVPRGGGGGVEFITASPTASQRPVGSPVADRQNCMIPVFSPRAARGGSVSPSLCSVPLQSPTVAARRLHTTARSQSPRLHVKPGASPTVRGPDGEDMGFAGFCHSPKTDSRLQREADLAEAVTAAADFLSPQQRAASRMRDVHSGGPQEFSCSGPAFFARGVITSWRRRDLQFRDNTCFYEYVDPRTGDDRVAVLFHMDEVSRVLTRAKIPTTARKPSTRARMQTMISVECHVLHDAFNRNWVHLAFDTPPEHQEWAGTLSAAFAATRSGYYHSIVQATMGREGLVAVSHDDASTVCASPPALTLRSSRSPAWPGTSGVRGRF